MKKQLKNIDDFNPFVKLLTSDDKYIISNFNAGTDNFAFTEFIKKQAELDMNNGDGVTYLIIDKKENGDNILVAYYTISTGSINIIDRYDFEDNQIPESDKREHFSPVSAFYINMFAVSDDYQDSIFEGKLISGLILKNIINELLEMSFSVIGAKSIILCAVPKAVRFYKINGSFRELESKYTILDKIDVSGNVPMQLVLHKNTLLE